MKPAAALLALLLFGASPAASTPDLSQDALLRRHLWGELLAKPKEKRPVVGLVLSAGSLRATAHVGVISVLENAGFPIDVVAGTSMGAVIGSMYAGGKPAKRLWEIATTMTFNSGSNFSKVRLLSLILSDKLLSSESTAKFINDELGGRRFEQLVKPFACVAMDIYTGEAIIFREGELAPAVRASMNLPGLFEPVQYRHRYLVDGGVVDYIPIDAARLLGAQWVVASITENDYRRVKPKSVLESLEQVIDIRGAFLSREQRKQANFLIEPAVGEIGMFQAARAKEAMSKGVIAANSAVKAAMESLLLFSMDSLAEDYGPQARP